LNKSKRLPAGIFGVSVMHGGVVSFFQTVNIDSAGCSLQILRKTLSAGVNQITLFDDKGEIFAERLFFIHPKEDEMTKISIKPNKKTYLPSEKVSLDIKVLSEQSAATTFSFAVRDPQQMTLGLNTENIATNLLLSSDLKGYIENPSYYFENNDKEHEQALDLLMLTQGWRRYEWQTLAGKALFEVKQPFEKKLTIRGKVFKTDLENATINLTAQTSNGFRADSSTVINRDGSFHFSFDNFQDTCYLSFSSKDIEDGAKNIRLDRWFSPKPQPYKPLQMEWFNFNTDENKKTGSKTSITKNYSADSTQMNYLINEVEVAAQKTKKKDLTYNVGEDIDRFIDLGQKYPVSVHEYLSLVDKQYLYEHKVDTTIGKVDNSPFFDKDLAIAPEPPGAWGTFYYSKPHIATFFHWYNDKWDRLSKHVFSTEGWKTTTRLYFTWQRPIVEVEKIVISGAMYKDERGYRSVPIYIYPYKNIFARNLLNTRYTSFEGFSKPKEFYKASEIGKDGLPETIDHKRTLYWNPNVTTDNSGRANITFYNNLSCRYFDITAEGIGTNGNILVGTHDSYLKKQ